MVVVRNEKNNKAIENGAYPCKKNTKQKKYCNKKKG